MTPVVERGFAKAILLAAICVLAYPALSSAVDFDRGVDAKESLEKAKAAAQASAVSHKSCRVDFPGQKISLHKPYNYARARYSVKDDCSVALDEVIYSTAGASAAQANPGTSAPGRRNSNTSTIRKAGPGKNSTFGCTVNGWEEDVAGIQMIVMQNHTTWNTDDQGITDGTINGHAQANLDWWHVSAQPTVNIGFPDANDGSSTGYDEFYCDGADFCLSCQNGCRITLTSYLDFDSGGGCSGGTGFSGEVVPAGKINWELIQQ
jgi:hypothetical protein